MSHPWATVGKGHGGQYDYFDEDAEVLTEPGSDLPHWRQAGAIYFVTFRSADSIPIDRLNEWREERERWLAAHPVPRSKETTREYHRRFTKRWHGWLDEAHGACVLKDAGLRQIVERTLRHCDGADGGYALDEFVIMPNHVHVLVSPFRGQSLNEILRTWKSVSAHAINKAMGASGPLWQKESWDHIVRSPLYLDKYRRYIQENPKDLPRQA